METQNEAARIETEPPLPLATDLSASLDYVNSTNVTGFFRRQRQTIEELTAENEKLRGENDRLQREMSRSSIEAIKQVQQELTKALEKQKEENKALQAKLDEGAKEVERVRDSLNMQLATRDEKVKQMTSESNKMREYVNKLITTHADKPKVMALERRLTEVVGQLARVMGECEQQRQDLDRKEKESQRVHELMKKLEHESRTYAAIVRYHTLKSKRTVALGVTHGLVEGRGDPSCETSRVVTPSSTFMMNGSFMRPNNFREMSSFRDQASSMTLKIVKPIKGGAPPAQPAAQHSRITMGVPRLQLGSLVKSEPRAEGPLDSSRCGRVSMFDPGEKQKPLMTARADTGPGSTVKDKMYVQNLRKFNLLLETQKASKTHSSSDSDGEGDEEDGHDQVCRTERGGYDKMIGEKLFG